jgi:hypothetical protein
MALVLKTTIKLFPSYFLPFIQTGDERSDVRSEKSLCGGTEESIRTL